VQWRLLKWDPDHIKRHHGDVDCPGHETAVEVENDEKDRQFHSKKNRCCYSWVVAVAVCYWAAATGSLYSAAGSDLTTQICTLPATKPQTYKVSRRSNT